MVDAQDVVVQLADADRAGLQPLQAAADVGDVALDAAETRVHAAQQGEDEVVDRLAHGAKDKELDVGEQ